MSQLLNNRWVCTGAPCATEGEVHLATIDERGALMLLHNGGHYEDDPVPARVYQYWRTDEPGAEVTEHYAVFYQKYHDDMHLSPMVHTYTLLFEDGLLTAAGHLFVEKHRRDHS
jgi:hypothetical protein